MHHRVQEKRKKQGEARKSSLRGCRARRSYKKSFLREHSVSFLLKSHSLRNAELTAKSQRDTVEIEGEEVQKTFLRGCRTYSEKSALIHRKISGKETSVIPKGMKAMVVASYVCLDIHLHGTLHHTFAFINIYLDIHRIIIIITYIYRRMLRL